MATRKFRQVRGAAATAAPPFTFYLADALVFGYELLLGTSNLAADARGNLDPERARIAWQAHRDKVLEPAAEHRPGRVIWAQQQ
jgi:hypothetical protein